MSIFEAMRMIRGARLLVLVLAAMMVLAALVSPPVAAAPSGKSSGAALDKKSDTDKGTKADKSTKAKPQYWEPTGYSCPKRQYRAWWYGSWVNGTGWYRCLWSNVWDDYMWYFWRVTLPCAVEPSPTARAAAAQKEAQPVTTQKGQKVSPQC